MGRTYLSSRNGRLNFCKKASEFMLHLAVVIKSTLTFHHTHKLLRHHVPHDSNLTHIGCYMILYRTGYTDKLELCLCHTFRNKLACFHHSICAYCANVK